MGERGNWCASSGFLDSRNACRNPDGCVCDTIIALRARLETVEAETRERCAITAETHWLTLCGELSRHRERHEHGLGIAAAIRNLDPLS